jgi:hypothetical protein
MFRYNHTWYSILINKDMKRFKLHIRSL